MFGGAMVGPYPIFGLRPVEVMGDNHWSVVDVTRRYRIDGVAGTEDWVVFSEDHAGNPVVGQRVSGLVERQPQFRHQPRRFRAACDRPGRGLCGRPRDL